MAERESSIQHDNDQARVNQLTFFSEGDETGVHVHEFDYIVVPVTGGDLTVIAADGSSSVRHQEAGVSYLGAAGTRHNVISASPTVVTFVEIELKTSGAGG